MAMVATIASESHQYLQDWFKKHYVTIGNKTLLICLPQPKAYGFGVFLYKENFYLEEHKLMAYLNSKVSLKIITLDANHVFVNIFHSKGKKMHFYKLLSIPFSIFFTM